MLTNFRKCVLAFALLAILYPSDGFTQFENRWMSVGSLHNWFSEVGCEIEVGRSSRSPQQDGLQWPAIYSFQDNQAAKGLWIGAKNVTDDRGDFYDYRVVHVGPRVNGVGEFYPVKFEMRSKFPQPVVQVDGLLSYSKEVEDHPIDPNLKADRIILNEVNTLLGLTMKRKIMQYSQQYNDNYMIYEYTFINTGNTDADEEIELPGQTLEDVYVFGQYRYSATFQTRYLIANATGWGINTMIDARGDGEENMALYDPEDEKMYDNGRRMRVQFAWHGYYPDKVPDWDNIGAPIFYPGDGSAYIAQSDTIGRLGAPQFMGIGTLHADADAGDSTDDPAQPSTTGHFGSDEPLTFANNNSAYNKANMEEEYLDWMARGHMSPRHAWIVEPSGNFAEQTNNPALGTPGGYSIGSGYGPYDFGFGDSIKIVMVEAVAGLSRTNCIKHGRDYKNGVISDVEKNTLVLTGKDSLLQTMKRAMRAYDNNYEIPQPPKPPSTFIVRGDSNKISLEWDVYEVDPELEGFKIFRSSGKYNDALNPPELLAEVGPEERSYDDFTAVRGVGYFYYIQSFGGTIDPDPYLNIPGGTLVSSRYWTQTYDPAFLTKPSARRVTKSRVVPNPYIISSSEDRLRFGSDERDKLTFFNIPGRCTIKIFTESGELVNTIEHTDGSADESWKAVTASNQLVVSGLYVAVIENHDTGEKEILKFVVIR